MELRPTVFFSVPRLYNRIYDRVMNTINGGNPVSRSLFQRAFAYKKAALERGDLSGGRFGPFWDTLVFSKIKARLGGVLPWASPGFIGIRIQAFWGLCFGYVAAFKDGLVKVTGSKGAGPALASTTHQYRQGQPAGENFEGMLCRPCDLRTTGCHPP